MTELKIKTQEVNWSTAIDLSTLRICLPPLRGGIFVRLVFQKHITGLVRFILTALDRRTFLRQTGIAMALPLLDSMWPGRIQAAEASAPHRLVAICTSLGLHAPSLFPDATGPDYPLTPYLELIKESRDDFTVFSGISHPDQSGADGHSSEVTWLTAARHPGLGGFRNSISVDQLAAEKLGIVTRFSSLQLGTSNNSQSYTRSGVMIPADHKPSLVFAKLFLEGSPDEIRRQMRRVQEGRSIMDAMSGQVRKLEARIGQSDRSRLDEYFSSIREMEKRLAAAEDWARKPKPQVDEAVPADIQEENDLIGRIRLLFDLVPLALRTDSTRLITILVQGRNDVPRVPGVEMDHHNLSNHGQDENKLRQLHLIERAQMETFGGLIKALKQTPEAAGSLLDKTSVIFGSNLGNANSHDTRNLPVILAGGGFKHGQHLKLDTSNNTPLSNLYVQVLQRMGLEIDSFGTSSAAYVRGLESV